MKIQTKLTLFFSLIFGVILLLFIVVVYHFYSNKCKDDYFERLHLRAALKVDLIDGEAISPDILHLLYENSPQNSEPRVIIYNEQGKLIYQDRSNTICCEDHCQHIREICEKGQCKSWDGKLQTYAFFVKGKKENYAVSATGYDIHGAEQLQTLRLVFGIAYVIVMLCIVLTIRVFTRQAFRPVSRMIEKVKDITDSHHLDIRLDEGNRKDELAKLAITFNHMLRQLSTSFEAQKQFVYHISHELRTPLSAIITELELSKTNGHKEQDYKKVIDRTLKDSRRLVKLSNNLLDMAKANYSPSEIAMHKVRLDELLLEVSRKIQKTEPDYRIHIFFDNDEQDDDRLISLKGNEYLLSVAFGNLIDNGCKFSEDKTCEVHISYEKNYVTIRIIDHGIGISPEDKESIFTPFFRGSNKNFIEGNGIGLSLTYRIIKIHEGEITFKSQTGLTVFTVKLKNLLSE